MKALMGVGSDVETLRLLDEIQSLRSRVRELEAALDEAESGRDRTATVDAEVRGELVEAAANA